MPKFLLNTIFLQFPHKVSSPSEEEAEHMHKHSCSKQNACWVAEKRGWSKKWIIMWHEKENIKAQKIWLLALKLDIQQHAVSIHTHKHLSHKCISWGSVLVMAFRKSFWKKVLYTYFYILSSWKLLTFGKQKMKYHLYADIDYPRKRVLTLLFLVYNTCNTK